MKRGKLITIEGIEGAGKSTALQFILEYLANNYISIVATREPGGTPLAEEIRCLLLHHQFSEAMASDTELLLMFAARAQHIQQLILPTLNKGAWVLSDRYVDASYAYQGGGRGLSLEKIKTLETLVVEKVQPDLTLLLDIPPELGLKRAEGRGDAKDRIEQEEVEFFTRVRQAYLNRANENKERIKIVDASLDLAAVTSQIQLILDDFIMRNPA